MSTPSAIIDALKSDNANARITTGNRWLVWDGASEKWEVYERIRGGSMKLYAGSSEAIAAAYLLGDDEEEQ